MSQQIIGLAGRKGSGKDTAKNFILGLHLIALGIVKENFSINPKGMLVVSDLFGDKEQEGIFDVNRQTPDMEAFLFEHVDTFVKVYNFADLLKQDVCMRILGLTHEQCYGTDDQKNSLTNLKWEDMPGMKEYNVPHHIQQEITGKCMTAREVMQYVGSDIFRKMYNNVWVDSTMRRIKEEESSTAILVDCRFPNEVDGIQQAGGKVVRLTRNPYNDQHISETALDPTNFDWSKFDFVLDNKDMNIDQQNDATYKLLKDWQMLPIELNI